MISLIFDTLNLNTVVNGDFAVKAESDLIENRKDVISLVGYLLSLRLIYCRC